MAGVSGNGQRELGDVILGLEKIPEGTKHLLGHDVSHWPVCPGSRRGVAFIPEDPLGMAAFSWLCVEENMAVADTRRYSRQRGFAMDREAFGLTWRRPSAAGIDHPGLLCPPGDPFGGERAADGPGPGARPRAAADHRLLPDPRPRRAERRGGAGSSSLPRRRRGVLLISEDLDELFGR